jgi:hypothetical protein
MTANNNNLFKDQVLNILEGKDTEFYLERFLPMPAEEFKNNFRKFK